MLQFTVIGHLGADAQVKEENGRKYVSFNVAHTERWSKEDGTTQERTQWVSCTMDGDGGKVLNYLVKGRQVCVIGHGSARVYSSAKTKRFEAGLNCSVIRLELIGSRVDDVPARLYDAEGVEHVVNKAYYVREQEAAALGVTENKNAVLQTPDGKQFQVIKGGWVVPMPSESTSNNTADETT